MAVITKNWEPISRVAGSLGLQADIDLGTKTVKNCRTTSSVFRGFSMFMKGRDPRDMHYYASRICGMCGGNHTTTSTYAVNMACGIAPPPLAEWIVNLGEAAQYMFDHLMVQDALVGVDFSADVVKETSPSVWAKAQTTFATNSEIHGFRTIADIMSALNCLTGSYYQQALKNSRLTREMFCLMEGRHPHPSTIYPGGVGTVPSVGLFQEYQSRLMEYIEFVKKTVPFYDDLIDFFYTKVPGYENVGKRRVLLYALGSMNDPDVTDYTYANLTDSGRARFISPGIVVDGALVTTDLIAINQGLRSSVPSSYFDDWIDQPKMVDRDPAGNPIDIRHPWNQQTIPHPQAKSAAKYTWVVSPRWADANGNLLALDTGGGGLARLWVTALANMVHIPGIESTGSSVKISLPKTLHSGPVDFEWKIPQYSNCLERNRARAYFQAYAAAVALYCVSKALLLVYRGQTATFTNFTVPKEAIGVGMHEAVRGALSHHLVIKDGKIANYQPYAPTAWNASPRDAAGVPGPYEDAVQNTPILEESPVSSFQGVDIMRAVRSFDPCLACGVHMSLGKGRVIERYHSLMFGNRD